VDVLGNVPLIVAVEVVKRFSTTRAFVTENHRFLGLNNAIEQVEVGVGHSVDEL
jgi:hypothetical protein